MDLLIRLRKWALDSHPQVSFSYPNFKREDYYTNKNSEDNSEILLVDYSIKNESLRRESFIRFGMAAFAKMLSWSKGSPPFKPGILYRYAETLVEMYKFRPPQHIEVDCNIDKTNYRCNRVTPRDILTEINIMELTT